MVTARELVVPNGSFTSDSMSVDGSAIYIFMRATRDTQSPMLKGEK